MDALVYDDHPLATYFEGDTLPCELSRESTPPPTLFAPRRLPDLRSRLRTIRKSGLSISSTSTSTEQLLERFRYVIVASQLLSDEAGPQAVTSDDYSTHFYSTSITGAVVTGTLSFLVAWGLHWAKTRRRRLQTTSWIELVIYSFVLLLLASGTVIVAKHQYVKHLQKSTVQTLSRLIKTSHDLDNTTGNAIRFIQEVEVVARGYELSLPLPPITRLEDRQAIKQCRTLRNELVTALKALTMHLVNSHHAVQPHINTTDLQRYHDIYEISLVEYSQAIDLSNHQADESHDSLKEIRLSLHLYLVARKVFLCDLLAIKPTSGVPALSQWRNVLHILEDLQLNTLSKVHDLSNTLSIEEWGNSSGTHHERKFSNATHQSDIELLPDLHNIRSRTRRFDEIIQSIRALNAKVHVLKQEATCLNLPDSDDAVLASTLSKHYEALGADIKSLLVDWEKGRNTMHFNGDINSTTSNRHSHASSGQSPLSNSPSLGGTTVVDGGPAEALRLLTGADELENNDTASPLKKLTEYNEQVFEAIAVKPVRKRMSIAGLTREEKIAKLKEDRLKRATIQEQTDNNTNMLRELRMVIKHRPQASISQPTPRITSI